MAAVSKYPVVKTAVVGPSLVVVPGVLPVAGTRQDTSKATDIKIAPFANGYDIDLSSDGDFKTINGMDTALVMSVLCERRLAEDEEPINVKRGGWLGNAYNDKQNFEIGSKAWMFYGSKLTQSTMNGIKDKSLSGIQWLLDDNYAIDTSAEVSRSGDKTGTIDIKITRPEGDVSLTSVSLWNSTPDT